MSITAILPTTASATSAVPVRVAPLFIGPVQVHPPVLQAPMAGFSSYAFRQIVREFGGAGLQATEMVNGKAFVWLDEHQCEHPERLWACEMNRGRSPFRFGIPTPRYSPRSALGWHTNIE